MGRRLQDILGLPSPPLYQPHTYRQLHYVEQYVCEKSLGCKCVVIEDHYVDRDHIGDHSVFYSKSLSTFTNYCRRVHFFRSTPEEVRLGLQRILAAKTAQSFREQSVAFSTDTYLGFCVIKPLDGCPVGRTVLHLYPEVSPDGLGRRFDCTCWYEAHLIGVPLRVRGLAFQQQDFGVSACATTAVWSALQRSRAMEGGDPATPAEITIRASKFALPFGRLMPAEGLSVAQMCQAIHSFGYSPNLMRADHIDEAKGVIYSAIASGIAPVLVLMRGEDNHAVTVAGMKVAKQHSTRSRAGVVADVASDLLSVYIHDDRYGPYLKADLKSSSGRTQLEFRLRETGRSERWSLTHVLAPVHSKVRLSFAELQRVAFHLASSIGAHKEALGMVTSLIEVKYVTMRSHAYVESNIGDEDGLPGELLGKLCSSVAMPRYVGVVTLKSEGLDAIEAFIDTTSTERNLNVVALLRRSRRKPNTVVLLELLGKMYGCAHFA